MKINTLAKNAVLMLALSLTLSSAHAQSSQFGGNGLLGESSIATGITEIDGEKMKFDGGTKVLDDDGTENEYITFPEVQEGTEVDWRARKGPRYPILLWIKPILS